MKAKIRGTEIYFDVAGMHIAPIKKGFEERPVIFMLHGGPGGDHLRYKQHSLELADVAQLIFIDNRGCGRSKKTRRKDYNLENNIEDIEALRKYLGLEKICVLGTSYGGVVAQGYAIKYPEHLQKLMLVVTSPSFRSFIESKSILKERGTKAQQRICERKLWPGAFKNPRDVNQFFKIMEGLYSTKKKKKLSYNKSTTIWSHEALNEGFGGFLRKYDFVPQLKRIKAPTLILAGGKDWICPPSQSKIIAQHIPHATLKIFPKSGHALAVDAHQQYIRTIKKFLAS